MQTITREELTDLALRRLAERAFDGRETTGFNLGGVTTRDRRQLQFGWDVTPDGIVFGVSARWTGRLYSSCFVVEEGQRDAVLRSVLDQVRAFLAERLAQEEPKTVIAEDKARPSKRAEVPR